jgi:hypothetical protein
MILIYDYINQLKKAICGVILAWLKTTNSQLLEFHHPFRVLKNVDHTDPCHNSKPLGTWNSWTSFLSDWCVAFPLVQHGNDEIPRDGHFMTFQWATHLFTGMNRWVSHSKNPIFCGIFPVPLGDPWWKPVPWPVLPETPRWTDRGSSTAASAPSSVPSAPSPTCWTCSVVAHERMAMGPHGG